MLLKVSVLFGLLILSALAAFGGRYLRPLALAQCLSITYPFVTLAYIEFFELENVAFKAYFAPDLLDGFFWIGVAGYAGFSVVLALSWRMSSYSAPSVHADRALWRCTIVLIWVCNAVLLLFGYYFHDLLISDYLFSAARAAETSERARIVGNVIIAVSFVFSLCVAILVRGPRQVGLTVILPLTVFVCIFIAFRIRLPLFISALVLLFSLILGRKLGGKAKLWMVFGGAATLLLFIGVNGIRHADNMDSAVMDFTNEFLFGAISALSSQYWISTREPVEAFQMLIVDPLRGLIPSVIGSSIFDDGSRLEFERWKDSIGGQEEYNPVGGAYLPGQFFLFTGSYFGVAALSGLYGLLIVFVEWHLLRSRSVIKNAAAVLALVIVVFGATRIEYWIIWKLLVTFAVVVPFLFWCAVSAYRAAHVAHHSAEY